MYSITQSPTMALDLAHAVIDERRAHTLGPRRTPKLRASRADDRSRSWWPSAWSRPVAAA